MITIAGLNPSVLFDYAIQLLEFLTFPAPLFSCCLNRLYELLLSIC